MVVSWDWKIVRHAHPDGIISPAGPTWRSLNGNAANMQSIRPQVVATVTASALGAGMRAASYAEFNQGDYTESLFTSSVTIKAKGCYLCTIVMAATALGSRTSVWDTANVSVNPSELTPHLGNLIANAGATHIGPDIKAAQFCRHLGMRYQLYAQGVPRGYPCSMTLNSSDVEKIRVLLSTGAIAANVNYTCNGRVGQHWILIVAKNSDGSFVALDPANGKRILLWGDVGKSVQLRIAAPNSGIILFGAAITCSTLAGSADFHANKVQRTGLTKKQAEEVLVVVLKHDNVRLSLLSLINSVVLFFISGS